MLNITSRRIRNLHTRRLAQAGVDSSSWYFLRVLWIQNGLTQKQIAERTGLRQPTAAIALKKMLAKKLITTKLDPNDGRSARIYLTNKGRENHAKILPLIQAGHRLVTEGLTQNEMAFLREIMRRIRGNCDRYA